MERTRQPITVLCGTALGLAVAAVAAFAVADAVGSTAMETERVFLLAVLAGWALLAWATIIGALSAAFLLRGGMARRRLDGGLLVACAAVVALVAATHPLWGSGSGVG